MAKTISLPWRRITSHYCSVQQGMNFLHEYTVTFLQFLINPNFDLEPDYFFGRPMNRCFQRYIVHTEILSTFHAQVDDISVKNMPFKPMGAKTPKPPFTLGYMDPHLIHYTHPWTDSTHHLPLPLSESSIGSCTSTQLHNKVRTGYNGTPRIYPKTATSPLEITTPSNTLIPWLTPLTTPNIIQIKLAVLPQWTFWTDLQTDRPTERWDRRQVCTKSANALLYWQRAMH